MRKIWRDRWLEWLETPGRPQAVGCYYDSANNCYCAVGGLCRIIADCGGSTLTGDMDDILLNATYDHDVEDDVLFMVEQITWLPTNCTSDIADHNDNYDDTLPDIAAWVRRNVPEEV